VTNLAEELEESINENNKLSKRNSFLSKQSTTLSTRNDTLEKVKQNNHHARALYKGRTDAKYKGHNFEPSKI